AALDTAQGTILLHIFLDRCSVEVFANNGLTCLSDLIYPSAESLGLEFFTTGGGVHIRSLDIYRMAETKTH
ncbi:MAG TPA: GH32 C-terminal domain-containing protein, partial [Anaerolineales bacterium]|nr:GH32 C-terminal domain-containing protein [Anaerolineales bacterium]